MKSRGIYEMGHALSALRESGAGEQALSPLTQAFQKRIQEAYPLDESTSQEVQPIARPDNTGMGAAAGSYLGVNGLLPKTSRTVQGEAAQPETGDDFAGLLKNQGALPSQDANPTRPRQPFFSGLSKREEAQRRFEETRNDRKSYQDKMLDIYGQRIGMRQSTDASHAGQAFEHDPVIKGLRVQQNALGRAKGLLDGSAAINAKTLNAIQQDFINALAAGGAATEGKVNREMIQTLQMSLNDLKSKLGNQEDIRKSDPKTVEYLRGLINQVGAEYNRALSEQANRVYSQYSDSTNPLTQKTIERKRQEYSAPTQTETAPPGQGGLTGAYRAGDVITLKTDKGPYKAGQKLRVGADGVSLEPI
jgi:hypothetical protein